MIAARRAAFEPAGRCDESLFSCGEERDLYRRLIAAGHGIEHAPDIEVLHKVSPAGRVRWQGGRYDRTVRNALCTNRKVGTPLPQFPPGAAAFLATGARHGLLPDTLRALRGATRRAWRRPSGARRRNGASGTGSTSGLGGEGGAEREAGAESSAHPGEDGAIPGLGKAGEVPDRRGVPPERRGSAAAMNSVWQFQSGESRPRGWPSAAAAAFSALWSCQRQRSECNMRNSRAAADSAPSPNGPRGGRPR